MSLPFLLFDAILRKSVKMVVPARGILVVPFGVNFGCLLALPVEGKPV